MKMSDWLLLAGEYGVALLRRCEDMELRYQKLFISFSLLLESVISRRIDSKNLKQQQTDASILCCHWELLLPTTTFRIGLHHLNHIFDQIALFGPIPTSWTFSSERFQYVLTRHRRVQSNREAAIATEAALIELGGYLKITLGWLWRHERQPKPWVKPPQYLVDPVIEMPRKQIFGCLSDPVAQQALEYWQYQDEMKFDELYELYSVDFNATILERVVLNGCKFQTFEID